MHVHAVFYSANFERSDARNFTKIVLLLGFIDAISINCAIVNIVSFLHLYTPIIKTLFGYKIESSCGSLSPAAALRIED